MSKTVHEEINVGIQFRYWIFLNQIQKSGNPEVMIQNSKSG